MTDPTDKLSPAESAAIAHVLEALRGLDGAQVDRVLTQVQDQLALDDSAPAFSRGIAGPLGKLNCDLKTKIDEVTHDLWLPYCAARQSDTAGVLRDCVYGLMHGKTYGQMVVERVNHDAKRTEALVKLIGPFGALEFGGAGR